MKSEEVEFHAIICGKLLGNGQIVYQENDKYYFKFTHRSDKSDWAIHTYHQLKTHIPSLSYSHKKVKDRRSKTFFTEQLFVESKSDDNIRELHKHWYSSNQKVLPLAFLEEYLNANALALWYQDSGHLQKNENGILEKIIFSTGKWSDEELEILKYVLNLKHGLLFSIDGQRRLILYDQFQINYLLGLVHPYMHPTFIHKMKTVTVLKPIAKRTTICLDDSLPITSPTSEINEKIFEFAPSFQLTDESFKRLNYRRREQNKTSSYQIQINESNRHLICALQANTGLTMSELVYEFYHQHNCQAPRLLSSMDDLTTTQQNIVLGSIIGDGMLTHSPTKHMGVRSSYVEHFSIKQHNYRGWKVMKLAPYLKFRMNGTVISSETDKLWSELQPLFYAPSAIGKARVKRLPENLIERMHDLHSLATIYMDDGSLMISYRINHRSEKIYLIPHIALYLQNFTRQELQVLKKHIYKLTSINFALSKQPDGNGYNLRTYQTADTLKFMSIIWPVTETCPSMSYKVNWIYRLYNERQKWKEKYPDYQVLTSSRNRMRPYTTKEIASLVAMKQNNNTDHEIAQELNRTYWSVVYKAAELRKSGKL